MLTICLMNHWVLLSLFNLASPGDHSSFEPATPKRAGELGDRRSSHSEHSSGSGSSNCELPSKVPLRYIHLAINVNVFGLDRSTWLVLKWRQKLLSVWIYIFMIVSVMVGHMQVQGCRHGRLETQVTVCSRSFAQAFATMPLCVCDMHNWPGPVPFMFYCLLALDSRRQFGTGLWVRHLRASFWSWQVCFVSQLYEPFCKTMSWAFHFKHKRSLRSNCSQTALFHLSRNPATGLYSAVEGSLLPPQENNLSRSIPISYKYYTPLGLFRTSLLVVTCTTSGQDSLGRCVHWQLLQIRVLNASCSFGAGQP